MTRSSKSTRTTAEQTDFRTFPPLINNQILIIRLLLHSIKVFSIFQVIIFGLKINFIASGQYQISEGSPGQILPNCYNNTWTPQSVDFINPTTSQSCNLPLSPAIRVEWALIEILFTDNSEGFRAVKNVSSEFLNPIGMFATESVVEPYLGTTVITKVIR